ncbi:MAG: DegQ family serine endoprotease [Gammaproteobacteria bacterium]
MIGKWVTTTFVAVLVLFAPGAWAAMPLLGGENGPTLAPLMKQVTPAVVNIAVRSRVAAPLNPLLRDPFFRRFFDLPDRVPERQRVSAGSGVIVDAGKGYILTNNHVIENADEIQATLKDGRRLEAKLIGRDPDTDIALVQIKADKLTALPLGNSDQLEVGDFVVAIGNPFGLGQTVTSGIVSALGRSGLNIEGYEDFIQTDASINPGNSGGALVNLKGELIGINTAIIGPTGGNVGIGFAVPSNMARAVLDQLAGYGKVQRGQLGVVVQDLTPELAKAFELRAGSVQGAVVTEVTPASPAQKAGLRPGDVIVSINGREVRNSADLRNRIGLARAGSGVEIVFVREGDQRSLRVKLGAGSAKAELAEPSDDSSQLAGALFKDSEDGKGVIVADVQPDSPAAYYGLRPDDLIVAVNRKPVNSVAELKKVLESANRVLALNVQRGDTALFIIVQ